MYNALIIGSGVAGLSLALHLADTQKVCLLSKDRISGSSSYKAQGGIAAVVNEQDTIESHIEDTMRAGDMLNDREIVELVATEAGKAIQSLINIGVQFTRESGKLHLTQEGGHSIRRVLHVLDHTGKALVDALYSEVQKHPNITILSHYIAIDLIDSLRFGDKRSHCLGVYALNKQTGQVEIFRANSVTLATGGVSKVYLYSTNPTGVSGDGIAMAWRAGCPVANLEFHQFHPTCLYHSSSPSFLISEAVRGEGGKLCLPDGTKFMQKYHQ